MAAADVYDARISKRGYKAAMIREQAVAVMSCGRGGHFDPEILDAFLLYQDDFRAIAQRYSDD